MSSQTDQFGSLLEWGYNNGATSVNSEQFVLNALAFAVFNTSIAIGGSETVFQKQTVPCDPNEDAFGTFVDNAGCKACRESRVEFENLRFDLETAAIVNSNNAYERSVLSDNVKKRFQQPTNNDICKFVCASCVILNANQGTRSSISSTQNWDAGFDVEFQRQLNSSLASSIQKQAKEMEKWLQNVTYEKQDDGVYKMCKQVGYTADCVDPIKADLEQRINVRLTSEFKVEILEKIRLYQSIEIKPSESLWITDVSQSFSAEIVNEVVSTVMKNVTFYNQELLKQQVKVFENNSQFNDTMDTFMDLVSSFDENLMSTLFMFGVKRFVSALYR